MIGTHPHEQSSTRAELCGRKQTDGSPISCSS